MVNCAPKSFGRRRSGMPQGDAPDPRLEGRYRAVFHSAADAILVSDRENRLVDANPASLDLLEMPREEVLLRDCGGIFAGAEDGEFPRSVLTRGETRRDVEDAVVARGGKRRPVLVTASPLVGSTGGVSGAVYILRDISPIKRLNRELRRQATTDELTGLVNRRGLIHALEVELSRARRHGRSLSVLMMDLDGFKAYNDANGHLAGDEALKVIARLLSDGSRREDVVARYGGEEFVALLPETDREQAVMKAERTRKEIASWPFAGGSITASIGVLTCGPSGRAEMADILKRVDEALYEAKRTGKNRVAVGDPM